MGAGGTFDGRMFGGARGARHRGVPTFVAVLLGAALLAIPADALGAGKYPSSMASTGDSITRAYNTGFFPFTDNPAASWSTGTNSTVVSHYTRLLALNPRIRGRNYNDARSGAKMQDLAGQVTTVNSQHVGYVTVLMGGNDVCTPSESTMTSASAFEAQFVAAMDSLTSGSPSALIFVATIPDVYQLWLTEKDNFSARATWALFGVCQSMLANPLSAEQADVDRRERVRQREMAFNDALLRVCAAYRQCRSDNGAVFNTAFTAADVSTRDYFHPSLVGQAKLAAGTWAVSYWAP